MSNNSFSIKGQDALIKKLQHNMQKTAVKQIVKTHTIDMHNKVIENMNNVYTGHYEGNKFVSPTGNTRRQTKVEFDNGGLTGKSVTDTPYIGYLENGTRFMAARPAIGPAWRKERPLFLAELWDLVR